MRTATRVEYHMPGAFFPEEGGLEVQTTDPLEILLRLPASAYVFRIYELTYLRATDELGNEVELPPKRSEVSGRYYIDAEVYDLAAVKQLGAERHRILIANMEANHWEQVVRCRTGNWQPLEAGDQILVTR